ncbi:MAG: ELWxxDGT repeat protein [Bacteroidota bacterium]
MAYKMTQLLTFTALCLGFSVWHHSLQAQASLVKDIRPGGSTSFSGSSSMIDVNGTLFFTANDGINGEELWKSDGTATGTVMVKDIRLGSDDSKPEELTHVSGILFFRANDGIHGDELWKSDGTAAGTVMVKDIRTGSAAAFPESLTEVNGMLYFSADNGINGIELFKSDGTPMGTDIVRDIRPGLSSSWPIYLTNVGGTLFFRALDMTQGQELWKSDGTAAGTVIVKDIKQGSGSSAPNHLTAVNGLLFFSADDGSSGDELWVSDGTDPGTVMLMDIHPGSANAISALNVFVNGNGILYFSANDGIHGNELWKSDGTSTGTTLVRDIHPSGSSNIWEMIEMNGHLFFGADDGTNGHELWTSDGSSAGTVMVSDIHAGSGSSGSIHLTEVNGTLFFRADDGTHGQELWQSDGTNSGTVLVQDIHPGMQGSWPQFLTEANNRLFFVANDIVHGAELWTMIPIGPPPAMEFVLSVQTAGVGSSVSLPVMVNHVSGISAYQGTISFDSAILSVDTVINSSLAGSHTIGLPGTGNVPANALSFNWMDSSQNMTSLPDSTIVMDIVFSIHPTAPHGFTSIQMDSSVLDLGYSTDSSMSVFAAAMSNIGGIFVINSPPDIVTQDITVSLDPFGQASISPADIDNGSSDVYGLDSLFLDIDQFDCDDVGSPVLVTLTGINIYGNSASANALITVQADPVIPLSGAAFSLGGDSIPGVIYDLSGDDGPLMQTASNFSFLAAPCISTNDIGAKKIDDAATNNGLDIDDATAIIDHIIGQNPFTSPYQLIAADLNASSFFDPTAPSKINTLDVILLLQKIALAQTHFFNPQTGVQDAIWTFIPSDYVFPNPADPVGFDSRRAYIDPSPSTDQNFLGVKLGDVDNSWDHTVLRRPAPEDSIFFEIEEVIVQPGEIITIPLRTRDFHDVRGYQFTMQWNPEVLQFRSVHHHALSAIYGTSQAEDGSLTVAWANMSGQGITLSDGTPAFVIEVEVLGKWGTETRIEMNSALTPNMAKDDEGTYLGVGNSPHRIRIGTSTALDPWKLKGYTLSQNSPNPFQQSTSLTFSIGQREEVDISIYTLTGKLIQQFKGTYPTGEHDIFWNGTSQSGKPVSEGMYLLHMKAGEFQTSIKMVKGQ